ncbi:polysaccharide deacetylase family protein [Niveibacterium terrae]|uniref:polysaccharide deacetylase family protein n=1 Tax=Niveibacterium terrae TaxID=3373598 RepID=UPI003A91D49E
MLIRSCLKALSPAGRRARLSIFLWHRVLPERDPMFPGEIDAARFSAALGWISRWFNVLPLSDAVTRLREGSLPERAAAISFDDGYADNLTVAAPRLKSQGLPATFFVASGYINGGRMWNDSLIEAIRRSPLSELDLGPWGSYSLADWGARGRSAQTLIGRIKYLPPLLREQAVREIATSAQARLPEDLMLSRDQLRVLSAQGFEIGAHTVSHPILAGLSDHDAREEICAGRRELEAIIDRRVGLFAYPNGKPGRDYTSRHVAMVEALGFDAAVSTAWGASASADERYQLRRFTPWDASRLRFGLRLFGNLARPTRQALV